MSSESSKSLAKHEAMPVMRRRVFVAAALSGLCAAAVAGLGYVGLLGAPERADFQFARGTSFAQGEEARLRAFLTPAVQDSQFHVSIIGHTGSQGDPAANLDLSEARAGLASEIAADLGIAADRIDAHGVGGASPLAREDGLSDRAYQALLSRVEISIQARP